MCASQVAAMAPQQLRALLITAPCPGVPMATAVAADRVPCRRSVCVCVCVGPVWWAAGCELSRPLSGQQEKDERVGANKAPSIHSSSFSFRSTHISRRKLSPKHADTHTHTHANTHTHTHTVAQRENPSVVRHRDMGAPTTPHICKSAVFYSQVRSGLPGVAVRM